MTSRCPNSKGPATAFTLIEVLVALAVFAVAAGVFVAALQSGVDALVRAGETGDRVGARELVLRTILAIEDRDEFEDGGDFPLRDGERVEWEVELEETEMLDLFSVQITLTEGTLFEGTEDQGETIEMYLYRPGWMQQSDRSSLAQEREDALRDRRR